MPNVTPEARKLPDPWLFDSEALLRELDRCRETILQIPITNANATHFGIQLAVNAIHTLPENLRHLLHLHRAQQRDIRKQHEHDLATALLPTTKPTKIVNMHTPTHRNGTTQSAKRRRVPFSKTRSAA